MKVTKQELFERGVVLTKLFCTSNALPLPEIRQVDQDQWSFAACAYYRPVYIAICLGKCACPGHAGRAWSWPGYVIDRTPYGVLQHELGHHADMVHSHTKDRYRGNYSIDVRFVTKEDPLTSYCPNDGEWFAEMFRLFVTNPDLLRLVRPKTFKALSRKFIVAETRSWDAVLADAPERTIAMAQKKMMVKEISNGFF